MNETMRNEVDRTGRLSRVRVRLEVLWLRSGKNPDLFRELIVDACRGELPLALMICDSPGEVAEETLAGVKLEVGGVLSAGEAELLSRSESSSDRCLAARASIASAEVLVRLADDEDWGVRVGEVLERFADDEAPTVRRWVASNLSTPDSVLERLADDPEPSVRDAAAESLKVRRKSG